MISVDDRFTDNKLLSQIVKSKTHRNDIIQGLRLGVTVEDIIRIYEEYYHERGLKTYQGLDNQTKKLKPWR